MEGSDFLEGIQKVLLSAASLPGNFLKLSFSLCLGLFRTHWPCHRQLHVGHLVVWICHPDVDSERRGTYGWVGCGCRAGVLLTRLPSPPAPCDADSHVFLHYTVRNENRWLHVHLGLLLLLLLCPSAEAWLAPHLSPFHPHHPFLLLLPVYFTRFLSSGRN